MMARHKYVMIAFSIIINFNCFATIPTVATLTTKSKDGFGVYLAND
jgi:hypothetical protein